jgi:hypothetical protein
MTVFGIIQRVEPLLGTIVVGECVQNIDNPHFVAAY